MTGRERVLAALAHEEPDRVPLVIGGTNATGIKMKSYRALAALLGEEPGDRYIYDWPELGTALPTEGILERLGADTRSILDRFPAFVYERAKARPPHADFIDDWGGGAKEIEPGSWYPGIHPLAAATSIAEIEAYPWPDMDDPTRVANVRAEARALAADGRHAVIGCPWLLFPFERAQAMRGLDNFLADMVAEPEFASALLWKIEGLCKTLMGHFLDEAGDALDMIKIGDDLGMQENLLISPTTYREILRPVHADLIDFIKSRTKAKVFFHTDGDVYDLIPDFIELGVDILNPIQSSAGRMSDLPRLKREYGDNLVFCGAIDTQRILPYGSPEEVKAEVRRVIDTLGSGGGYMLAAVHTIMNEVPPENILAMVDAAKEYGGYKA
ncbi:MAG TPA: uroporphyrinogen decarboxylase family protein [Rectinemataceae bacterium]|nr:uroporphyrinogen decarboxylase family protein [Rectinemataceae bacterium]